ncbi:unnamed protein product [Closterium sp. NIES-64]|nr:unnamed protein product [Closterium sp. NIES-64]
MRSFIGDTLPSFTLPPPTTRFPALYPPPSPVPPSPRPSALRCSHPPFPCPSSPRYEDEASEVEEGEEKRGRASREGMLRWGVAAHIGAQEGEGTYERRQAGHC